MVEFDRLDILGNRFLGLFGAQTSLDAPAPGGNIATLHGRRWWTQTAPAALLLLDNSAARSPPCPVTAMEFNTWRADPAQYACRLTFKRLLTARAIIWDVPPVAARWGGDVLARAVHRSLLMRKIVPLATLIATLATVTTAPAADATPTDEQVSPSFVLAPTANVVLGAGTLFGTELGGNALFAPTPWLRLGVSGALSREVLNSMEGCSIVKICVTSWTRAAVNFEHHLRPQKTFDFWWGVQAGPEWRQVQVFHYNAVGNRTFTDQSRTLALIQPNIGIDVGAANGRGFFGLGLYAGIPVVLGSDLQGAGLVFGIRGLLGVR